MRNNQYVTLFFFFILPLNVFAADKTITCDGPAVMRDDNASMPVAQNKSDASAKEGMKMAGMKSVITISDNQHDVTFLVNGATVSHSPVVKGEGKMKVTVANESQISFTGLVRGAPVDATYYPKMNILIYSQHSVWPGNQLTGEKGKLFFSKCRDE